MTSFDTTGHVALRISLSGGEVTIEAVDRPGVDVEVVPLRDNDVTRKAVAETRVEMIDRGAGHEVIVEIGKSSGFTLGRGAKVGVRVRCPLGSDVSFRASSADLDGTGQLGAVDAKSASGDITLEDVRRLEADTASGDVRVRDTAETLAVRTASGDVTARRCLGPLSANLVSGDLIVAEAAAGLAATTVSGDVYVSAAGGGDMRLQAVSGDVHLAISRGERIYVDAASVSGTMQSELGLDSGPQLDADGPVYDVRVRTVSGDLQITRATAVHS